MHSRSTKLQCLLHPKYEGQEKDAVAVAAVAAVMAVVDKRENQHGKWITTYCSLTAPFQSFFFAGSLSVFVVDVLFSQRFFFSF